MAKRLALVLAALLALPACGGVQTTPEAPAMEPDDTTLGGGDVFDVRVYGETDLTGSYRVAQDGSIDFPFIGRIAVEGLEPTEVADLVGARLREAGLLRNPQVSIFVREYNSKRVSVMGAVANAGTFPMTQGLTVVQVISLAGGFTALASRNNTVVTREVEGELRRFRVPVDEVTRGNTSDFVLRAGDIVYVPERAF